MTYDFSSIVSREGINAAAMNNPIKGSTVKEGFTKIPMHVADMNYATVPTIAEEIKKRLENPTFGYFGTADEYYDSIIDWHKKRNGIDFLEKEHIGYENGVLGGVISAMGVLASKGDKVLVHAPTYVGFTFVLKANGYDIVHSQLYQDEEGIWRMDYEDMDKKLKENNIHVAIFCSPHNPCGRVWEKWEIEKAMEVYKNNDCYVISDEIWSDIILYGNKHIPTQSVSEDAKMRTVAMYAPSKTFNLAGLQGAYHVIYNKWIRDRVMKESSLTHYNSMNVLSMHALIGAYKPEGHVWVDELRETIGKNVDYAYDYFTTKVKGISVMKPQGTYMLYLNLEEYCKNTGKTLDEVLIAGADHGVLWQDGRPFHRPYAIRLNLAVPFCMLEDAIDRLSKYVFND